MSCKTYTQKVEDIAGFIWEASAIPISPTEYYIMVDGYDLTIPTPLFRFRAPSLSYATERLYGNPHHPVPTLISQEYED